MRIALLGGTGAIGEGLALRFGAHTTHEIVVGSRDADRAIEAAVDYEEALSVHGSDTSIGAGVNIDAVSGADVAILGVPPYHVRETIETIRDGLEDEAILVTPAVGMSRSETGCHYDPPPIGSVSELVANVAPASVPVVGAYHSIPAGRLANLETAIDMDTPVVADDEAAKETVQNLTNEIPGLSPIDAGPLANAAGVESLAPLLVTLKHHNESLPELGIRFD
jgi:NADPH-dependent F420 reductase